MKTRIRSRTAIVLLASFAIALLWPNVPMASAAPAVVRSTTRANAFHAATRAPIRFNFVAATWTLGETPQLDVRTSRDGVSWSEWATLEPDDTGPDRGDHSDTSAVHSSAVWIGDASHVQTRGSGKLELLNVNGNADDPPAPVRALRSFARWAATARPAEAAGAGPIGIYTRKQWGADESLRAGAEPIEYAKVNKMSFIHHTDGSNGYSAGEVPGIIRGIYYYHVKVRDYKDIAYNFLVDRFGRLWEGRTGGMDKTVIGGHTAGLNTSSIGVAMLGTYSSLTPPTATQYAIVHLLDWKFSIHRILPRYTTTMTVNYSGAKWPAGTTVRLNTISGHRDAVSTACPGNAGYSTLNNIRSRVHARILPSGAYVIGGNARFKVVNGGRLSISTLEMLTTHAAEREQITLTAEESAAMPYLGTLGFREGSLVVGDKSGTVYVVSDRKLRPFKTATDFNKLGFRWDRIVKTSSALLARFPVGEPVDPVQHPNGVLLRPTTSPGVALLRAGKLVSIPSGQILRSWQYASGDVIAVAPEVFAKYAPEGVLGFRDGTLLKGSTSAVYFISEGLRRPFQSAAVFSYLAFKWANVVSVPDSLLQLHAVGRAVTIQS